MLNQTQTKPTSYWAQLIGLRQGDQLSLRWYTPWNTLWYEYNLDIDQDWWYYYFWSHIDPGTLEEGAWHVKFYRNGEEVDDLEFTVAHTTSVQHRLRENCAQVSEEAIEKVEVFDFFGRPVSTGAAARGARVFPVIEKLFLVSGAVCIRKVFLGL